MENLNPVHNCAICPRLKAFRLANKELFPNWFNAPVPIFAPKAGLNSVKLLIIGLAPGLKGANRTGRPFTADYAGDLLYSTLLKYGLASGNYRANINDRLELHQTAIANAVRCVPPQNKPLGSEINNCRQFLTPIIANSPNLKAILTLGTIAHNSILRLLGLALKNYKFGHNNKYIFDNKILISSYHCSRYNTNTGKLTEQMFHNIFENILEAIF